jgi:hypothetical protein
MLSFEDKTVPNSSILVKLISPAYSAVGRAIERPGVPEGAAAGGG